MELLIAPQELPIIAPGIHNILNGKKCCSQENENTQNNKKMKQNIISTQHQGKVYQQPENHFGTVEGCHEHYAEKLKSVKNDCDHYTGNSRNDYGHYVDHTEKANGLYDNQNENVKNDNGPRVGQIWNANGPRDGQIDNGKKANGPHVGQIWNANEATWNTNDITDNANEVDMNNKEHEIVDFPTKRRITRMDLEAVDYPPKKELERWIKDMGVQIGQLAEVGNLKERLMKLLWAYKHLNGTTLDVHTPTDLIVHRPNFVPGLAKWSVHSQIRWPPAKEKWMQTLIQQGLDGGIFERTMVASKKLSEWNSRIVLVDKPGSKPGDEPRLAFDYSRLKEIMPGSCMELASKVHDYLSDPRHQVFIQADLKHAYFGIVLDKEYRHYYAFTVPGFGQLQPTRMPQGSGTSSFTMNELMNIAFGPIPAPQTEPSLFSLTEPPPIKFYLDDIFGGFASSEAAVDYLEQHLFPRLDWAKVKISFKKLRLLQTEIVALGVEHLTQGRLRIKSARISKILDWPEPKDQRSVRAFVGMLGITRRWVRNFSEIARPLQRLCGKIPFTWGPSERLSFTLLKHLCATNTLMHGIDWEKQVHLYTDASGFAGGLVVTQWHSSQNETDDELIEVPILYDSYAFSKTERAYGTYKRELCVIVHFCKKYSYMLQDPCRPAIVHTDHKPLVHFLESEFHDGIYARWAATLWSMNMKIVYIKGLRNEIADGLSRTLFSSAECEPNTCVEKALDELHAQGPKWIWKDGKDGFAEFLKSLPSNQAAEVINTGTISGMNVFMCQATQDDDWDFAYRSSAWFATYWIYHKNVSSADSLEPKELRKVLSYRIHERRLWYTFREETLLCIPESKVVELLYQAHDEKGHLGKESTLLNLKGTYWPARSTDVEKYIRGCIHCAEHAPARKTQLLHPMLIKHPMQLLAMDWIGPLRVTPSNNRYIFHAMDYMSQFSFAKAYPVNNARETIEALKEFCSTFAKPNGIYCDHGQHFRSEVKWAMDDIGVTLTWGPAKSSKSFGLIERGNRLLEDVLRKYGPAWDENLAEAVSIVNGRIILHLGMSPREVLMGLKPTALKSLYTPWPTESVLHQVNIMANEQLHAAAVNQYLNGIKSARHRVWTDIKAQKQRMADSYNRGIRQMNYNTGDMVMLFQKDTGKLNPRWRGPFRIKSIGEHGVSYWLEQLNGKDIPRRYHGDHLRLFVPRTGHLISGNEPELPTEQNIRPYRPKRN